MKKIIKFLKSAIAYIKSLGWGKDDVKKILMFTIMLLIACFIVNNFLKVRINGDVEVNGDVGVNGSVDANVSGFIN